MEFLSPIVCRFCTKTFPGPAKLLKKNKCRLEFDDGAIEVLVWTNWCPACRYRNMTDRKEEGIIFHSHNTAYWEVFLFELAVRLSRQGCSMLTSTFGKVTTS